MGGEGEGQRWMEKDSDGWRRTAMDGGQRWMEDSDGWRTAMEKDSDGWRTAMDGEG